MFGKFYDVIGFAEDRETSPGVYKASIIEKTYCILIVSGSKQYVHNEINENVDYSNTFSIISDGYVEYNCHNMRYVHYNGEYWEIKKAIPEGNRIRLIVGGIYNGPKLPR